MRYKDRKLSYINNVIRDIRALVSDIHEALVDEDFVVASFKIKEVEDIMFELNKSITNEI